MTFTLICFDRLFTASDASSLTLHIRLEEGFNTNSQLPRFVELLCWGNPLRDIKPVRAEMESGVIAVLCSVLVQTLRLLGCLGPWPPGSIRKVPFPDPHLQTASRWVPSTHSSNARGLTTERMRSRPYSNQCTVAIKSHVSVENMSKLSLRRKLV